ncbi:hypothetical protein F3087_40245 [Nocardia colli]|uniref:Uncharacterized protein n=1 Tax=Nocardia colli TaxID=2545717 RepID=A0A5N0DZT5_9NOCA|nr:hypothetical protein [Nocardia colli]KAA8881900.1 hypothetical protein F3087_40245 [Nocardia colli]
MSDSYALFGNLANKKDLHLPLTPKVPPNLPATVGAAPGSAVVREYQKAVQALASASARFDVIQNKVMTTVAAVAVTTKTGQDNIRSLISATNRWVSTLKGSDAYHVDPGFVDMLDKAFAEIATGLELAARDNDLAVKRIDDSTAQLGTGTGKGSTDYDRKISDDVLNSPWHNTSFDTPDTAGADSAASEFGRNPSDAIQRAIDNVLAQPSQSPLNSGLGAGFDPMLGQLMSTLAQQGLQRGYPGDDYNRLDRLEPINYDRMPPPVMPIAPAPAPPPVVPPATAPGPTPWSSQNQPGAVQPGTANGTPPPGGTPPIRTPGADGSVDYMFPPPDGRTQKVSVMVAQALDAAFADTGTDAQIAYQKTRAKWTDPKKIGTPVDPYQLMTGDIATWDKDKSVVTAVVVVWGPDQGNTLEVIVNGKKQSFAAEMSDESGKLGDFAGFLHPQGIELAGRTDDGTTGLPGPADHPAGTLVPVTAGPLTG